MGIGEFRLDEIALALGKFIPADQQPAVPVYLFGHRKPQRHQQRRPDDRVEPHDLLPHHVKIRRPEFFK